MKEIQLTQGKVAIVDDEDFERLNQYKWQADKNKTGNYYARRVLFRNGKRISLLMHREIMNATNDKMVDHKNGNGLDNRKINLRFCNIEQNAANQKNPHKDNKLGIKGVCWIKAKRKYKATIVREGVLYHLGYFTKPMEADEAYRKAEKKYSGEFARDV